MQIREFEPGIDLQKLEKFLRDQYLENKTVLSWLPERLHDIIYRMGAQESDFGRARSMDYIFLWEENREIAACILPDGENVYMSIKSGYEHLFHSVLSFSEQNCLPLFSKADDGSVKFWVAVNNRFSYMQEALTKAGYSRYPEEEYTNCAFPDKKIDDADLPEGFKLLYGEDYADEENKWTALRLGFHPDLETADYRANMHPYISRKSSSMYPDSFECFVIDENSHDKNNVCSYCFVYVDMQSKTALIEPVSTREKYRHKGFGTAMMRGVLLKCRELGVEKCYVNSFGQRKEFYNSAGFVTECSVSFWHKIIR